MAHTVVKILSSDDGEKRHSPVWCYVEVMSGDPRTLCEGEVFGFGQSSCRYKEKIVEKGGITCQNCLRIIHRHKAINL